MSDSLTRRKALGVVAAVPVALALGSTVVTPGEDRLLALVRRYEAGLAIIDSNDEPTDKEVSEWDDSAEAILKKAASLPCLTAASAVALLDVVGGRICWKTPTSSPSTSPPWLVR